MTAVKRRMSAALLTFVMIALVMIVPAQIQAQAAGVDPEATRILKKMTDHLGGLERFSVEVYNLADDVLISGQKIQYDLHASLLIRRPDRLRAERLGDLYQQVIVYDGSDLTIYNPDQGFYATTAAPDNIDDLLHFARDELDIVPPSGDLVFTNSYELLTAPITSGMVVGKSVVDGVVCDHLAFTTPLVDWQIWIAAEGKPLPYKYVLNTNDDPAQPQDIVLMSNWNSAPKAGDEMFEIVLPKDAEKIDFIRVSTSTTPVR